MTARDLSRTSVNDLVHQHEEREFAAYFDRARHIEVSREAAIDSLNRMARSKVYWLRQHGGSRPKSDVAVQEHHLAVLVQMMDFFKGKANEPASAPAS
ncbi:hypothetical protein IB276_10845 [Ensifer sp. ENS04]|uniref:hypothetical protein n=1 Tax=Ensifer sp. ENS04 TaxID=2769281 RepID=UPI00177C9949|nr:hypothetical protein [Ensifer sp. ENS04]MBD9539948.1 hypothetical protein [Ensifer sp. ENS04]